MNVKDYVLKQMEKRQKQHSLNKEQDMLRQSLNGTSYKGTEVVFNQYTLAWLVVGVTVLLQIISLATTFEGSKVYFGGVKLPLGLSAPLFFALAIQSIVFAMSHVIRRYFKMWLVMILMLATLCSTYFSYIGIYNYINSPISYLEERYNQIYDNLNNQYQLVKENTEGQMKTYVFDMTRMISEDYTALSKKLDENNALQKLVDEMEVETQTLSPQVGALERPRRSDFGDDVAAYYDAMRSYNAAVSGMITDTTIQGNNLNNTLKESQIKAYLGGKTREEFTKETIAIATSKEQLEKTIHNMYVLIKPEGTDETFDAKLAVIQSYLMNFIIQREGSSEYFAMLMTQLQTVVSQLGETNAFVGFDKALGHFMLLAKEDTVLMKPLNEIKQEVYTTLRGVEATGEEVVLSQEDGMLLYSLLQSEIKRAAYEMNQMEGLQTKIDLNDATYQMHNLYVLPVKNLLDKSDTQAMAWFCMGFAVLIDGLTLLFALMQGREKTMLFAKSNKEAIGTSKEAIEELLLTTIRDNYTSFDEGSIVKSVSTHLQQFLRPLKLMPEGLTSGYSMWCPLDQLEKYSVFIAVLCQFNLASIIGKEDLIWIEDKKDISDEKYLMVKTKFVIWAKQKITDLSLKEAYIEAVHTMEKELVVEGDNL